MASTKQPLVLGESRKSGGRVKAFGDGRVCAAAECETVLSRYNDKTVCWRHEKATTPPRIRARRPR